MREEETLRIDVMGEVENEMTSEYTDVESIHIEEWAEKKKRNIDNFVRWWKENVETVKRAPADKHPMRKHWPMCLGGGDWEHELSFYESVMVSDGEKDGN